MIFSKIEKKHVHNNTLFIEVLQYKYKYDIIFPDIVIMKKREKR